MARLAAGLLAHQGGWDEILFVAAPLLVLVALLGLANRRANAALNDGAVPDPDESDPDGSDSDESGESDEDESGDDPVNPSTPDTSAP